MSWFKFLPPAVSDIDNMVARNASLEEFLDCDELSTNYKSQNRLLIEFFSKPDVIKKLLSYLINVEKNTDIRRYKYSFLAADLLSDDIPSVRDVLLQPDNINILFDAIIQSPSIEAPYAHHICRLFHSLLTQCGKEVLVQIEEKDIVPKMFDHLQSFPFCELLFDIIMIIEQQRDKSGVIEFFHKYDVIYNLLHKMQTSPYFLVPPNAGQILTNIVRNFAPTHRLILFSEIFRPKETDVLLSISLHPSISILNFTHGISLLIDIVWNTRFNPEDPNNASQQTNSEPLDLSAPLPDAQNPPPPPRFITDNILAQLPAFVACLSYDWSSSSISSNMGGEEEEEEEEEKSGGSGKGGGSGSGEREGQGQQRQGQRKSKKLQTQTKTPQTQTPKGNKSSSSSSSSPSTNKPSPPASLSTSSTSTPTHTHTMHTHRHNNNNYNNNNYTHPYPTPSPHPTPTSTIFIPCPGILRGGRSVGNYRLKLIVLFSTLIRSGYNESIDDAFITSRAFVPLVGLFFSHPANNIVHSELYTLFEQTMLFRSLKLKIDLCVTSNLAQHVAKALLTESHRLAERALELQQQEAEGRQGQPPQTAPSSPYLAHVLHLARILEEHRETAPEVDEALRSCTEWAACYQAIVEPQMKEQESGLMPPPTDGEEMGYVGGQYDGMDPADMWNDTQAVGGMPGMGMIGVPGAGVGGEAANNNGEFHFPRTDDEPSANGPNR